MRRPSLEHRRISPTGGHQLGVRAGLHDAVVVDHDDPVGAHGRGEPVRDQDRRTPLAAARPAPPRPAARSAGRGWRSPRRAPPPAARPGTPGPAPAAAAPPTTPTGRARAAGCPARPASARPGRAARPRRPPPTPASSEASGRAKAMLSRSVPANRNGSCGTTPIWRRSDASVTSRRSCPSIRMRPAGRVVEPGDQLGQRRLAGPGRTDAGDRLARRDPQRHVFQDRPRRQISEGDVVEDDLPVHRRQTRPPTGDCTHRRRRAQQPADLADRGLAPAGTACRAAPAAAPAGRTR